MKYIQHTGKHHGSFSCHYIIKDGARQEKQQFIFRPEVIDRLQNRMSVSAYTPISEEQYEGLKSQSKLFNDAIERGWLDVLDQLPDEAKTSSDVIAQLQAQIADLQAKLDAAGSGDVATVQAALDAANGKVSDLTSQLTSANGTIATLQGSATQVASDLQDAKTQVTDLQNQLDSANGQVTNLNDQLTDKNQQIIDLQAELDAAKAGAPGEDLSDEPKAGSTEQQQQGT